MLLFWLFNYICVDICVDLIILCEPVATCTGSVEGLNNSTGGH